MKYFNSFAIAILAFALLPACQKPEPHPEINYYITAKASEQYDRVILGFDWISAVQERRDITASRRVYLDPQTVSLRTDGTQVPIFLGTDGIEVSQLRGYELDFRQHAVEANGLRRELSRADIHEVIIRTYRDILVTRETAITVTFVVDVDASVVPLPGGGAKFVGKVDVEVD